MHAQRSVGMSGLFGLSILVVGLYLFAVAREKRRGASWSRFRTASFVGGMGLVIFSLMPLMVSLSHRDLRVHMVQHVMLGMIGPVGVVLGAPVTLALRTLNVRSARRLVGVLRSPPIHWISHPVVALVLNVGGMAVLYATPLFAVMMADPRVHLVAHAHFLIAGCLFSWAIAGIDPGPARPSHVTRLVFLFIAIAAHATLAKAMYAYGWPPGTHYSAVEIRHAAKIMYYGGDLSELLLAIALFANWRGRSLNRLCGMLAYTRNCQTRRSPRVITRHR